MDRTHAATTGPVLDYERMAEQVRAVQRELAAISETAASDDGLIDATVGARGELTELWLDPRIYRSTDSAALAEQIIRAYRSAREAAARKAFDVSVSLLPEGAKRTDTDLDFDPVLHELDRLARTNGENG